jgi:SAM-dependent methyltransferase
MEHADHVALIRGGLEDAGPRWLELGAGRGAFTIALLDLLGASADVTAVDRDAPALQALFAQVRPFDGSVTTVVADFTEPLPVEGGSFDGVLMANALHFVRDKEPVLHEALRALRPDGRFVLVEYGADRGNPWVPWPISYPTWERLAGEVGLLDTRQIGEVPSRFLGTIYAAVSEWPGRTSAPPRGDEPPTHRGR